MKKIELTQFYYFYVVTSIKYLIVFPLLETFTMYRKVASSRLSRLLALFWIFWLIMEEKIDA